MKLAIYDGLGVRYMADFTLEDFYAMFPKKKDEPVIKEFHLVDGEARPGPKPKDKHRFQAGRECTNCKWHEEHRVHHSNHHDYSIEHRCMYFAGEPNPVEAGNKVAFMRCDTMRVGYCGWIGHLWEMK